MPIGKLVFTPQYRIDGRVLFCSVLSLPYLLMVMDYGLRREVELTCKYVKTSTKYAYYKGFSSYTGLSITCIAKYILNAFSNCLTRSAFCPISKLNSKNAGSANQVEAVSGQSSTVCEKCNKLWSRNNDKRTS